LRELTALPIHPSSIFGKEKGEWKRRKGGRGKGQRNDERKENKGRQGRKDPSKNNSEFCTLSKS